MKKSIYTEDRKYTFSDYFAMSASIEEIVAELGYSFFIQQLKLPRCKNYDNTIIEHLKNVYTNILIKINLNCEMSRREFLISPMLVELVQLMEMKIDSEKFIFVNDKLAGNFDYLLKARQRLIVIEAKNKDMEAGFKQLAAELIALDQYEETLQSPLFYGAITLGDFWKFAVLDRDKKQLIKDIDAYSVPHNTDEVFSILMGILNN
jgi:hypothetical protein